MDIFFVTIVHAGLSTVHVVVLDIVAYQAGIKDVLCSVTTVTDGFLLNYVCF